MYQPIYIYIGVLFDPVKPELGVIPSGQENQPIYIYIYRGIIQSS